MCVSVHAALRSSPFRWLILIDINTPVRLSLIICFIIILHSASSLYGSAYIHLGCLRDPASPILLLFYYFFYRISLRRPRRDLSGVETLKMSKELSFLSSSVTLLSEFHLFPFCFSPRMSATFFHARRRLHCKCHVEKKGRVTVCAWGGPLFVSWGSYATTEWQWKHRHEEADISVTATARLTSLTTSCVPRQTAGRAGGSFCARRQSALIRPHLERAALEPSTSEPGLEWVPVTVSGSNTCSCVAALFNWSPLVTQPKCIIPPHCRAL